ncbi:MAG: hypothetical protein KatS3mg110_0430 [Pirellulaceae bacterium]|nr:MAG: hypothetical protein KatS3mg110_0430 [Pirellulaceae bacterium]
MDYNKTLAREWEPERAMRAASAMRVVVVLVLLVAVATAVALLPTGEYLKWLLEKVESVGPWGPVLLAGVYAVACVFFIPGSMLTLGAGFLFGVVRGTIAVSAGSVLGATAAFLFGRTLLRGWVEKRIAGNPRFCAIDRALGQHGFKIVLLVRLSPVFPFNLLNYAFGLTDVRLWEYVLASWIGMLPGTLMYVYLGTALKSLADVVAGAPKGGTFQNLFFIVGLAMTVIATIVITQVARRALNEAVAGCRATAQDATEERAIHSNGSSVGVL